MIDSFNHIKALVKVINLASMSRAAEQLGCSRARVSQYISELEAHTGVRLLNRSTRHVTATEAGLAFGQRCRVILESWDEATEALHAGTEQIRGLLRITAPIDVSASLVAPTIATLREQYPELRIELIAGDSIVNLVQEEIDLSIRVGWLKDSTLRATKISEFEPVVCSHKDFPLGLSGKNAKDPDQLLDLPWVVLSILENPRRWEFTHQKGQQMTVKLPDQMMVNSPFVHKSMINSVCGIGICPSYQIQDELKAGIFRRLIPQWHLRKAGIYAVHTGADQPAPKVRAAIAALKAQANIQTKSI